LPLRIEQDQLPLLQLAYVGDYSDDELSEFLRVLEGVLQLPGRKACIIDLRKSTAGSAKHRKVQGEWIRDHEAQLARDFTAAAIVTDSAVIRGTVTAVFWIRPLPFPTKLCATIEDAQRWLAPYLSAL
jgi:hypothetical protein